MLNSDFKLVLKLKPLVDGMVFYKKFSVRQSLNGHAKTFDPLQAHLAPPEMCGYGLRVLQLDVVSAQIKVRSSCRQTAEMSIAVEDIIKPVIPAITLDIVREKQRSKQSVETEF